MHTWKKLSIGNSQTKTNKCNDWCLCQCWGAQMNPSTWTSVVTRRWWGVVEPRMFTAGGAHGRRSQGWRGPTPPRTGGRKGWYLWRELCFCGEAGRESSLPTGDPPPRFAAFLIKKFSFLAKKASPSLFKPLPFYLAICGLWHKLFRRPIHSYFKDLISFPVMSLYTLEPPFHFTELFFIPLIFFKKISSPKHHKKQNLHL